MAIPQGRPHDAGKSAAFKPFSSPDDPHPSEPEPAVVVEKKTDVSPYATTDFTRFRSS